MHKLVRKLHIYAGLLTFGHILIYGLAGLVATLQTSMERPKQPHLVRTVPFVVPASSTDKQVADLVFRTLRLPMTRPMPDWFLQHDASNHLLLDFYNINGIYRVVVEEEKSQLRIEQIRNNTWLFLEDIHAATSADEFSPPLVRAWGVWNEAAMWTLLAFCVSGVYLWLVSRPRMYLPWAALATGTACLFALWKTFR